MTEATRRRRLVVGPDDEPVTRPRATNNRQAREQIRAEESKVYIRTSLPSAPGLPDDVTEEEYTLGVHRFITEPARVSVNMGVTKSTGEGTYEFVRLDVRIDIPCYAEQVNEVYPIVSDMVADRLEEELDKFFAG
jgi:hypothetical protein